MTGKGETLRGLHPQIVEEGLDQTFNSLDAQREACEAYITSQAQEGWKLVKTAYDDGGISGGTLERPAFTAIAARPGPGAGRCDRGLQDRPVDTIPGGLRPHRRDARSTRRLLRLDHPVQHHDVGNLPLGYDVKDRQLVVNEAEAETVRYMF